MIRTHWKTIRSVITAVALAGVIALAIHEDRSGSRAPTLGSAPRFTLLDLAGQPTTLTQFRGHPVLLNFWATWCPPCRAELPDLQAISEEKPDCLQVVGISEGGDSRAHVAAFARARKLTYPILMDEGPVGRQYGVHTIPHSVLIDAEGNTVGTFEGPISREEVTHALAGIDPPNAC